MEPSIATLEPPALKPIPQLDPISTDEPRLTQVPSEWAKTGAKSAEESLNLESGAGIQRVSGTDATEEFIRPEQISRESSELRRVLAEEPTQLDSVSGESNKAEMMSLEEPIQVKGSVANETEIELKGVQGAHSNLSTGLSDAELIAVRVLSSPTEPNISTEDAPLSSAFPEATLSDKTGKASTKEAVEPSAPLKHKDPIGVRITPSATTETTISGPSSGPKSPKGDSKVSSWLKSKFSHRTSKTPKPEINEPESSSRLSVTSAPTAAAGASSSSLNRDESSACEAAIAGEKVAGAENYITVDDGLYAASASEPVKKRQKAISSSVSSVSDNDGERGQSELRREATSSSQSEEFEEARDHFDSEELAPPVSFNNNDRLSDSPVRDSKFQEDL